MVQFVNAVMIERRSRLVGALLVLLIATGLVAALAVFARHSIAAEVARQSDSLFAGYTELEDKVQNVFAGLHDQVTASRCSPAFQAELRRFAFLPDGISEFFHVANGSVVCSNSMGGFAEPVALGAPDMLYGANAPAWVDRDLTPFGLDGLIGTLVVQGDMGFILPHGEAKVESLPWLDFESVLIGPDGRGRHWNGREGIYDAVSDDPERPFVDLACERRQRFCVASRVDPVAFLFAYRLDLTLLASLLGALALVLSLAAKRGIARYCSFENRFKRHLNAASIICSYQPVMDLRTGAIVGCEVLARWRDVDGSVVFPDRFIPLVEREGMTLEFTRAIVDKAMAELSTALPRDRPLQVAFNVFPADLSDARLPDVFRACRADGERFSIIAEIVESAAFTAHEAKAQIEALRREGVRVYLDDFGSGYSNIQNIAALPLEGVKLDRAFAMAPDDSLMAKMLAHAVELIRVSERVVVVEGVETAAKLDFLRAMTAAVDRVQGYHIARPLSIEDFAAFLAAETAVDHLSEAA